MKDLNEVIEDRLFDDAEIRLLSEQIIGFYDEVTAKRNAWRKYIESLAKRVLPAMYFDPENGWTSWDATVQGRKLVVRGTIHDDRGAPTVKVETIDLGPGPVTPF